MATRVTPGSQHARATSATRPPERAQLVWRRALELADPLAQHDRFVLAMDLLRAAHHDSATMTHAVSLGRTQLRSNPGDAVALRGVKVLKAAIVLLGVKPSTGDIRSIK